MPGGGPTLHIRTLVIAEGRIRVSGFAERIAAILGTAADDGESGAESQDELGERRGEDQDEEPHDRDGGSLAHVGSSRLRSAGRYQCDRRTCQESQLGSRRTPVEGEGEQAVAVDEQHEL